MTDAELEQIRVRRNFITGVSTILGLNDQTYAGEDAYAVNPTRQYMVIGQQGQVGLEGGTGYAQNQAIKPANILMWVGVAAVAFFVLKKAGM